MLCTFEWFVQSTNHAALSADRTAINFMYGNILKFNS